MSNPALRKNGWAALWALALMACASRPPAVERPAAGPRADRPRPNCSGPLTLQVLGSGGPIPDDARASAGYLVWVNGKSRALVDAGGGVFQRFGEANATIGDLELIALTHLHADHSSDVAALLKGGYFSDRSAPLPVLGPSGNDRFPAVDRFIEALFSPENGAFRYLSGYVTGERGWFQLQPRVLDAKNGEPAPALSTESFEVTSVGVEHGSIPAVAYRLQSGGLSMVFGGDQSGNNPAFVDLARDADVLVMHHAIPEGAGPGIQKLHATPSQIGRAAASAGARRLVLSHHMTRALEDLEGGLAAISTSYEGPVDVAGDLDCYPLGE